MANGIETRHQTTCRSGRGGRCNCKPSYRAHAWSNGDGKLIRKTFPSKAAAKAWRSDAQTALRAGTMRAPTAQTLREAAAAWVAGAREGSIHNRSGDRYKPSVVRTYETALRLRVLPALGTYRLSELRRTDVQAFVDGLVQTSVDPSTVRNTLMPLQAIYRRHASRGDVAVNPTEGIERPAVRNRRLEIVSPTEAAKLLTVAPDRALWATAVYAGLRVGELRGLLWEEVDLATGVICVERGWDVMEGPVEPKTRSGRRRVPILAALRDQLVEHRMSSPGGGLVFGRTPDQPFTPTWIQKRADDAWKAAELKRTTPHVLRHTFASILIDAGVNAKAITSYMGHSSINVTFDLYGHLMPGNEAQAVALADAYLERANTAARLAAVA